METVDTRLGPTDREDVVDVVETVRQAASDHLPLSLSPQAVSILWGQIQELRTDCDALRSDLSLFLEAAGATSFADLVEQWVGSANDHRQGETET